MNNKGLEKEISNEIVSMIESRKSLMLSSLTEEGLPYASYAPFAIGDNCLYVLISEIAVHGKNLQLNPDASVLIIEDEDSAEELFARLRVVLKVNAQVMAVDSDGWNIGLNALTERHGDRISSLSQMGDFKLFKLNPMGGRYVKGFGRAYQIEGGSLGGTSLSHLREGHTKR
jgi:putative heme iron utilization protein